MPCRICRRRATPASRRSISASRCARRSGRLATGGVPILAYLREARPSRSSMTRVGWDGSRAFCPSISGTGARMTRPSPPANAPWRSPRPCGEVVLQALANLGLGFTYHAQGDYHRAIDCLGQTVAALEGVRRHERFGQVQLPLCSPMPTSRRAMPSWACSPRAGPSGRKGCGLPRRRRTPAA